MTGSLSLKGNEPVILSMSWQVSFRALRLFLLHLIADPEKLMQDTCAAGLLILRFACVPAPFIIYISS